MRFIDPRAQDEICERIVSDVEGIYYPYKPVDILKVAKALGLDTRYVSFPEGPGKRLGLFCDGNTPVYIMGKNGPVEKVFPENTVLIDQTLSDSRHLNKLRFTLGHEAYHRIKVLIKQNNMTEKPDDCSADVDPGERYSPEQMARILALEEYEANRGAAALLMPKKLMYVTMRTVMKDQPIIVYGDNYFDDDTVLKLREAAEFLQVSYTSLVIRLKHLNMLKKHDISEMMAGVKIVGGAD